MPTVIDSLIVQLGLDGSKFKKGAADAEKTTKNVQEVIGKSSWEMTRSLRSVATQVGAVVLGFEGAKGLLGFLGHLNSAQAAISRMSLNFGLSARSLDIWDKKIQLAGGSVQGAQASVNQLQHDLTAWRTMGQASPLVQYLMNLGVALKDSHGKVRGAIPIYEDLFKVLSKQPRNVAYQIAASMGVSPDILQYGLRPAGERAGIDAEARRLTRTTDANAKAADDLRERWVAIKQTIDGIGVVFLEKITPSIEKMLPAVETLGNEFSTWLSGLKPSTFRPFFKELKADVEDITTKLQHLNDAIEAIQYSWHHNILTRTGNALGGAAFKVTHPSEWGIMPLLKHIFSFPKESKNATRYIPAFDAAAKKYGIPAGVLPALAERESGFDPNAVSNRGAYGIMQLLRQYFPNAGKNPNADINVGAKYLRQLYDRFGSWTAALEAYNEGPTKLFGNKMIPLPSSQSYADHIMASSAAGRYSGKIVRNGGTSTHTTHVHQVVINTRATDGQEVARGFVKGMIHRGLIMQADSGMN